LFGKYILQKKIVIQNLIWMTIFTV